MCQPRSDAHGLPIPVAARMGGKSEENILSEPWRQVDQFSSRQVDMSRKVAYPHRINEPLQALDADQFEIGSDFAGRKQARPSHSNVERVLNGFDGTHLIILKFQDVAFFFAFEVNPFRRNLLEMYFHDFYLCPS